MEVNCAYENGPLFDDYSFWEGSWGVWMLYSCSLGWVDVFRHLGVHMGPILQQQQWIKCFRVPGGSQHNGGSKHISLPRWQFWGLGTPKWTHNLDSTHSKLSRMVRLVPGGLSGPELGQMRRPSWIWENAKVCRRFSQYWKNAYCYECWSLSEAKWNHINTQNSPCFLPTICWTRWHSILLIHHS